MLNYLKKGVLAVVCLTLFLAISGRGQTSDVGITLRLNPTTVAPGGTVGVFALVTNNTSAKLRTTVTFTSLSACGIQSNIGYSKLALNPGQSIQVTVSYPIATDACLGQYTVTATATSGAKSAPSSASATFTVQ